LKVVAKEEEEAPREAVLLVEKEVRVRVWVVILFTSFLIFKKFLI
jgi:hypothetical protein